MKITNSNKSISIPCIKCRGYKVIFDPNAPRDIIEGDKLRRRIKCPKCKGIGEGNELDYMEQYTDIIKGWEQEVEFHTKMNQKYKTILAKLTKEEIKLLGLDV